jgi:RNA polymerase sigma-70 factor (ECF subfamily)
MVSEKKIIADCIKGKRFAFEHLYKTYAPAMLSICMRYCKDRAEAEDILQEGFIKVFKKLKDFRSEGSFEGWIRRIMINTSINHYQQNLKHAFHSRIEHYQDLIAEEQDDELDPDINIPRDKVMALIQDMPDGYRFVFNMYVFEDYSHKEIAKELNISVNTSKTQLFKARGYLKRRLESSIRKKALSI